MKVHGFCHFMTSTVIHDDYWIRFFFPLFFFSFLFISLFLLQIFICLSDANPWNENTYIIILICEQKSEKEQEKCPEVSIQLNGGFGFNRHIYFQYKKFSTFLTPRPPNIHKNIQRSYDFKIFMINRTFLPTELCINRKSILIIEIPNESDNLLELCMTLFKIRLLHSRGKNYC